MTPMLKQYLEIKEHHKDKILFFRLGDFYEMFGEDAKKASSILDIVLTARHKGTENEIPMCGIPYHAVDQYAAKLTKAGLKIAICEQISDPKLPGIVKREVVQVITPGTTLNSSLLDKAENNYLVSVVSVNKEKSGVGALAPRRENEGESVLSNSVENFGMAFVDLTTGEFKISEIAGENNLVTELKKINPAELIYQNEGQKEVLPHICNEHCWQAGFKNVSRFIPQNYFEPENILCEQFKVRNLEGFGIAKMKLGIKAAANLVVYLKDTQKSQLAHINKLSLHNPFCYMILDEATIRNLDLVYNWQTRGKDGTLLSVLDKTATAMGARLLRQWLLHPLIDLEGIKKRLEAVEYFYEKDGLRNILRSKLIKILDIERILSRIGCNRANGRDLIGLKESLEVAEEIKFEVRNSKFENSNLFEEENEALKEVIEVIEKNIANDPPISIVEGGIIKEGVNQELDELRKISSGGKDWIANLQAKERQRTGINSLKIKFNRVFGYYIEVSNSNIKSVPNDYMRKQTLVNGERFITPELKEYEEKVLSADEKIKDIEYKIFNDLVKKMANYFEDIQMVAKEIAKLDVLLNFAQVSRENNYVLPVYDEDNSIRIKDGRHPVIEKMRGVDFVPNDSHFDHKTHELLLLTGPNMAGKSVYLRQNALIILMAQIGCYVPAAAAELSIIDRIFTRVGASDNIAYGQSTFMVEMQEAANILNNATERSLIIFDELGRGTSTYDGVSIAWAVVEFIHNNIKAKTLFATHYHELAQLANKLSKIQNYRVAVLENQEGVVFLHKVIKGGVDRSYGIEVAKLAGLPFELIERAKEILAGLEKNSHSPSSPTINMERKEMIQPSLIPVESQIEREIKNIDLNNMTPIDLMRWVSDLKRKIIFKK